MAMCLWPADPMDSRTSLRPSYIHLQREPLNLPPPPTCFRPEAVILRSSCRTMPPSSWLEEARHRLRSEEHTSELQSRLHLVCRLLLEKKKKHSDCMCRP